MQVTWLVQQERLNEQGGLLSTRDKHALNSLIYGMNQPIPHRHLSHHCNILFNVSFKQGLIDKSGRIKTLISSVLNLSCQRESSARAYLLMRTMSGSQTFTEGIRNTSIPSCSLGSQDNR